MYQQICLAYLLGKLADWLMQSQSHNLNSFSRLRCWAHGIASKLNQNFTWVIKTLWTQLAKTESQGVGLAFCTSSKLVGDVTATYQHLRTLHTGTCVVWFLIKDMVSKTILFFSCILYLKQNKTHITSKLLKEERLKGYKVCPVPLEN